jgi:outer membrane protein
MKQIKTLFMATILFLGTQVATAQSKVGHINVETLMTTMPAMKAADAQILKLKETLETEYKKMVSDYQTKAEKYRQEAETVGDAINQTRSQEMQDMGSRIQKFQEDSQKSLGDKEMELKKPLTEKAIAAIQKVGKAKGLNYVIDSTVGSGVLLADGVDILADVKKELGF